MTSFRRRGVGGALGILVASATVEAWAAVPPAVAYFTAPDPLGSEMGPRQLLVPPVRRQPRPKRRPAPRPVVARRWAPDDPESACAETESGPQRGLRLVEGTLRPGQKPRALLRELGVSGKDIRRMAKDFRPWVRLHRMRPGHEVKAAFRKGRLTWIRHRVGIREAYCARRDAKGRFAVLTDLLPLRTELELVEGVLLGPWADALVASGERRALGLFADALFPKSAPRISKRKSKKKNRKARKLAEPPFKGAPVQAPIFRMLVEKRFVEGRFLGYGAVPYIEVDHGAKVRTAVRFERGD
ncbi:MAG: hypothetical protein AAFU79_34900, partial [Myxococcota bacterium]